MPSEPASAALPTIEASGGTVFSIMSHDGISIRCARWPAPHPPARGTALFLQGRTEFIEKNLEAVGELRRRGFAVWTLDWRGQGLSGRLLDDRHKGHVADYDDYLQDLQLLIGGHLKDNMEGPLIMLAHSMGGHIGLRFLYDHPGLFDRAVLCAPMIGILGGLPGIGVRLLAAVAGVLGCANAYAFGTGPYGERARRFAGNQLTSDAGRFARMHAYIAAEPRLALGCPTFGWLAATFRSIGRLRRDAPAIRTPVLIISAGDDKVVDNAAQHRLHRGGIATCRLETVAGARHEMLCEEDTFRGQFWRLFDDFVDHPTEP